MNKIPTALILLSSALLWGHPNAIRGGDKAREPATIDVVVTGLRNQNGQICVSLFSSKTGFPDKPEKAFRTSKSRITGNEVKVGFDALPTGTYAIAALHDEDMNGKMNTSFWGFPKEGGGASNNPKPRRGPPRYEDAKFQLEKTHLTLQIKLIYPR